MDDTFREGIVAIVTDYCALAQGTDLETAGLRPDMSSVDFLNFTNLAFLDFHHKRMFMASDDWAWVMLRWCNLYMIILRSHNNWFVIDMAVRFAHGLLRPFHDDDFESDVENPIVARLTTECPVFFEFILSIMEDEYIEHVDGLEDDSEGWNNITVLKTVLFQTNSIALVDTVARLGILEDMPFTIVMEDHPDFKLNILSWMCKHRRVIMRTLEVGLISQGYIDEIARIMNDTPVSPPAPAANEPDAAALAYRVFFSWKECFGRRDEPCEGAFHNIVFMLHNKRVNDYMNMTMKQIVCYTMHPMGIHFAEANCKGNQARLLLAYSIMRSLSAIPAPFIPFTVKVAMALMHNNPAGLNRREVDPAIVQAERRKLESVMLAQCVTMHAGASVSFRALLMAYSSLLVINRDF